MARVVVVGSVNVDLVARVAHLPAPGETVTGGRFSQHSGGKGGNRAVASARLGTPTAMVGLVGDDDLGPGARRDLEEAGVDCAHLGTRAGATGVALILVDERGENLIAVASGVNAELEPEAVGAEVARLATAGAVVSADLEIPLEAVAAAAEAAQAAGAALLLNPAPARPLPAALVARCTVLTPNQHEVGVLGPGGVPGLLEQGAGAVVVTQGAAGATLHRPGRPAWHQPAFAVDVADTTGAGDAFNAALACALADGAEMEAAVRFATAAGALATRAHGARAALPDQAALTALLRSGEPARPTAR